jgi:hypothetical protein
VLASSEGLELFESVGALRQYKVTRANLLEFVGTTLPLASDLYTHLDAAVHFLCATLVVYTELQNISVFE